MLLPVSKPYSQTIVNRFFPFLPFLQVHFPSSPFPSFLLHSFPVPSSPFSCLPLIQWGVWEHWELPQRSAGWNPGRKRILGDILTSGNISGEWQCFFCSFSGNRIIDILSVQTSWICAKILKSPFQGWSRPSQIWPWLVCMVLRQSPHQSVEWDYILQSLLRNFSFDVFV